ncbi:MAG: sulfite exporter TauE/SafE family protein [Anditalea sp.]
MKEKPLWLFYGVIGLCILGFIISQAFFNVEAILPGEYEMFFWFLLVGLVAQTIDGALGMAYGITSNSILLGIGIPPASASAWVHLAQVFTSLASGISHWSLGNVKWDLAKKLLIPGVLGAVVGAYFLSSIDGEQIKPYVAAYLFIMGIVILQKVIKKKRAKINPEDKSIPYLALVGGFADTTGGGGWGPIVNSTLMSKGQTPRYAIGTVNFVEFFIAVAGAGTFFLFLDEISWAAVLGLILGGVIAAPFAAVVCNKVKPQSIMIIVGILIMVLSIRTFYLSF